MESVQTALYRAVKNYPGSAQGIAAVYGWNPQSLRNALNPNNPAHHLNLEHLEGIYQTTHDVRILDAVGEALECLMLPVAAVDGLASDEAVLENALVLFESTGKMIREVRESVADGAVDDAEWQQLRAASNELQRALAAVMARCDQLRG